jgi:hypothetical protein
MHPHICNALCIYYKIVLATDWSTGGLEDGGDLNNERDCEFDEGKDDDDEEGGMVGVNNNSVSFSADKEQLTVENDEWGQLDVEAAVASGRQASGGNQSSVLALLAGKRRVGEASSSKEVRDGG